MATASPSKLSRQFRKLASKKPGESRDPDLSFGEDEEEASEEEAWIYPEEGKQLYAKLIQPLKPYLPKQQVVYFSPDGELATLPFGILS